MGLRKINWSLNFVFCFAKCLAVIIEVQIKKKEKERGESINAAAIRTFLCERD